MLLKIRSNGKPAKCSIPSSSGQGQVIPLADALAQYSAPSPITGIVWAGAIKEMLIENERPECGVSGRVRYGSAGLLCDLTPSKRWWSLGHVGPGGSISLAEARADLDWLAEVQREAKALGLQIGIPDDCGEALDVTATVSIALRLADGRYIMRDEVGGDG